MPEQRRPILRDDAEARRARSTAILQREQVPINPGLPVIESQTEVRLPSTEEVAMRAAATLVVALKAEGVPADALESVVRAYGLTSWLSPEERKFLAEARPSQRERDTHLWRYEASNVLLWSLGYVPTLDAPREQCDPGKLVALLKGRSRAQFVAAARLRSPAEILDQADLIYRYRWALVDAGINGRTPPAGLSNDVAMERHQALNWLLYHSDTAWDDITLDT
ncbi:DUF4272 domain-containing protein [Sphingomonas sp. RB3P16]|uniref:DUF4272 domain-containing protein n=1 Tax=Parasphingomonas frigoris TaxID=3096163 RepID=UPI002FCCB47A